MRSISALSLASLLLASLLPLSLAACGSSGDGGGSGTPAVDAAPTPDGGGEPEFFASLTGTVWVPGNAPDMVPAGHEIPVFDAVVYLSSARPLPIEEGATCRPCVEAPTNAVQTDHKGSFTISRVTEGDYWLIIEKGDFRLEREITVTGTTTITLPAADTTLPSVNDVANGKTIPKVALATGTYDALEDILGKMGMGAVSASGKFEGPSAAGIFDLYDNGGDHTAQTIGTLGALVNDLDLMLTYDIIFIPCATAVHGGELDKLQVLRNIRDYVAAGGKLYVTDWAGEWADNVFPAQVQLDSSSDTPASAYNAASDTWNTGQFGDADGTPSYTSEHAEAVNEDLRLWLEGQVGPFSNGSVGTFTSTDMAVEGNWNHIEGLHAVQVGVDDEGNAIMDNPVKYVVGDDGQFSTTKKPLTVTYEPAGCGRVLYSTYHTTHNTHVGLAPQERVLVYLIMEIGVCKKDIEID